MKQPPWRLIVDTPQSAARNMAIDEAIAMAFEAGEVPPTLRFYAWKQPTFSIGAFQTLDAASLAALSQHSVDLVRRMTGGRALLHEHELTYSLVASTSDPQFSAGLKQTFQRVSEGLILGLQALHVAAMVHPPEHGTVPGRKNPLCFDAVSGYEITAQGRKLIGSAQRRWKDHFLQHGSLLLKEGGLALKLGEGDAAMLISKNQIALHELMTPLPDSAALVLALTRGFETALDVRFEAGELLASEKDRIDLLVETKYGRLAWNRDRAV